MIRQGARCGKVPVSFMFVSCDRGGSVLNFLKALGLKALKGYFIFGREQGCLKYCGDNIHEKWTATLSDRKI